MENHGGLLPDESKGKAPLDLRIIPYYFYFIGFCRIGFALVLLSGLARPAEPHRVLFGALALSSSLSDGIFMFLAGLSYLLCGWGLIRRVKWSWWFTVILLFYSRGRRVTPTHFTQWEIDKGCGSGYSADCHEDHCMEREGVWLVRCESSTPGRVTT